MNSINDLVTFFERLFCGERENGVWKIIFLTGPLDWIRLQFQFQFNYFNIVTFKFPQGDSDQVGIYHVMYRVSGRGSIKTVPAGVECRAEVPS